MPVPDVRASPGRLRRKAIDCVLLSISPNDAEVCLRSLVDVLDLVTLRLPGGEIRSMRCCWQTGLHVGLLTVGADPTAS